MADVITDVTDRKLYLRFPHRVPPAEVVKQLSPYIERVSYPRQKSARFCHVILENKDAIPEVFELLNRKEYNNGYLRVELPRKLQYAKNGQDLNISENGRQKTVSKEAKNSNLIKDTEMVSIDASGEHIHNSNEDRDQQFTVGKYVKRENGQYFEPGKHVRSRRLRPATGGNNDRRLWMKNLPFATNREDLVAAFPGCVWAKVYKSKAKKSSRALCKFSTAQQATSILSDHGKHRFRGKSIVVEMAESQELRGRHMPKHNGRNGSRQQSDKHSKTKSRNTAESGSDQEEVMDTDDDDDDGSKKFEKGSGNVISQELLVDTKSSSSDNGVPYVGGDNSDSAVNEGSDSDTNDGGGSDSDDND